MASGPFWSYIQPVEKTNLCLDPSFERGTAGVAAIQGATIGSAANEQQFGAWSCVITPTSNGTSGAAFGTWTAGNGTDYTVSAYVQGANGVNYALFIGDSNGVNVQAGSTPFVGGGTWQRYSLSYSEASGATRRVVLRKTSGNDTNPFYVDAVQIEVGSQTTYIDGDQEGCIWLGAPHASQSIRSGQSRAGGSVIPLASIGFTVDESLGIGMPQVENSSQSYAIVHGAEFQRQRARERVITLTSYLTGTTWQDLHQQRKNAINAFKIDAFTPQQPTRFWYTGAGGTVQIDAVYDAGLEFGKPDGFEETVSVRFVAYQPYWTATTQQGTALAGQVNLGSTNFIAKRDSLGRWGTLGANGSTVDNAVQALAYLNGTIIVGGGFGSTAGTRSGALSMYYPTPNTFGTFGGTVSNNGVNAITTTPDGTIIFGGQFTDISGLPNTRNIARYANGFATITGGTVSNTVRAFSWTGGTLAIVGAFNAVGGTANTGGLIFWRPSGYGTTLNGTIPTDVFGVATGLDRRLFVTFAASAAVGGTTANYVAQYFGSWGTMGSGLSGPSLAGAQPVGVGPNGVVYIGGEFGSAGGGSAQNAAQWNGVQWFRMADGLGNPNAGVNGIFGMAIDQLTGDVYFCGNNAANTGARAFPDGIAHWNGYAMLPMDIDFRANPAINAILFTPDRSLYVGGAMSGSAVAAAVAQVSNTGVGIAYPIFKVRNISGTTIRLYQLVNTLTSAALYFNQTFEPGEELTFVSEPGQRSFTSSFSGNVFGNLIPGSNITSFGLMPGINYISLFCDSGSVAASIYWTPRSDAADGGTVY